MYEREKTVPIPASASAINNNLARLFTGDQVYGAVIHHDEVHIVCMTDAVHSPIKLQPKIRGKPFDVIQTLWVPNVSGRHILVVAGAGGLVLYDWDGGVLLRVVEIESSEEQEEGGLSVRGLASIQGCIAAGCSNGEVVILSTGHEYPYIIRAEELYSEEEEVIHGTELTRFKWREHAVAALTACGHFIAVGDIRGNVTVGRLTEGVFVKTWDIESYGSAVSCMSALNGRLFTGFISGHIRVYDLNAKKITTEICGHARAVTAMDSVRGTADEGEDLRVVTASEDTFVRVWTVRDKKVEHLNSRCLPNKLLTGVRFTDDQGNGYVTTSYDVAEMTLYISD